MSSSYHLNQLLEGLNPEQQKAVSTIDKPVLLLAGAGSGKTKVITSRIAYLIANSVPSDAILALTFTNKAAREMKQRTIGILGKSAKKLTVTTFHAFCVQVLRQHIHLLDYNPNFVIYDTSDQQSVIKTIMEDAEWDELGVFDYKEAHYEILKAKGDGKLPRDFLMLQQNVRAQLLGNIFDKYNEVLFGCNAIDFEDILHLTLKLFADFPEELQPLFEKFQHVLVDEYQDTNRVQYQLVSYLTKKYRRLFVVGDDDQSIYGWRGADIRNILDFQKDFPEAEAIRMEQNYRSTPLILQAANEVIANNSNRMAKNLWSAAERGDKIRWILGNDQEDELTQVVQQIKLQQYDLKYQWKQFAILYRSNHQSRAIEEQLRNEGVPYQMVGGTSFFDRKEIQDCIAYLKFLRNPKDDVSLHRIINYPRRGIGQSSLIALNDIRKETGEHLFDIMGDMESLERIPTAAAKSMKSFAEMIQHYIKELENRPFYLVAKELFEDLGMAAAIEKQEKVPEQADKKKNNFYEFINTMYLYGDRKPGSDLRDFLEYLALFSDTDTMEDQNNQVTLMTVHSAKGLEFDHVSVVSMTEEIFPHKRSVEEGGLEEERRLFYVAVTRAKKHLILSSSRARKMYGDMLHCQPSRFIKEISPELFMNPPFAQVSEEEKEKQSDDARAAFFNRLKNKRQK